MYFNVKTMRLLYDIAIRKVILEILTYNLDELYTVPSSVA